MNEKTVNLILLKGRQWLTFVTLLVILFFTIWLIGECFIHESGHYTAGKIIGCKNLTINCSSFLGEKGYVTTGWKYCPNKIMESDEKTLICKPSSYFVTIMGLIFTILFLILILLLMKYVLIKINRGIPLKFYLTLLYFGLATLILTAGNDLYRIFNCFGLGNTANNSLIILDKYEKLLFIILLLILLMLDIFVVYCRKSKH